MQRSNYLNELLYIIFLLMKFFVFFILILLDYFSKKIIFNIIDLNNIITLLPFIDIIHFHNYGV